MAAALPPKVFVSYSHDSEAHRERVLALADRLRSEGLDVRIDRYVDNPAEGWPRWMERQLVECDLALLVCTATYRERFDRKETGGAGKGARYEAMIAEQILYEAHARNEKLVPVLFEDGNEEDVPLVLRAYTRYRLPGEYERLYGRLTGQHDTPAPAIGAIRALSPKARPGLVGSSSEAVVEREREEAPRVVITEEMLVNELAKVIPIEKDARFVVERAGYPPGQIPSFHRAIVFWSMVVNDARNGVLLGGVRALVVAAAKLAPGNAVFQRYLSQ